MDGKVISIGKQNFVILKWKTTLLLWINLTSLVTGGKRDETHLITRPRRLGKTLNMSSADRFFSIKYAPPGGDHH